jgi:CDP-glucose 4,6-dehydratase
MFFTPEFYKGKRVLLTGHTGFKGSWMSVVLVNAGATVIGYSTCSKHEQRLFDICGIKDQLIHIKGDVRDLDHLSKVFDEYDPDIVIHMAAQPLVRLSYEIPVETYSTNVMGTVNILECVRLHKQVKSFLNVTTDKVYKNEEKDEGYKENEPLDGFDPYSNSKSCSELVTHSYKNSYFSDGNTSISTARAGNVIGGGDFAKDRIIPDCIRSATNGEAITVRNPYSIRPYQHVLEPVMAYLLIASRQYEDSTYSGYYNVGPEISDCIHTGDLVDLFIDAWGDGIKRVDRADGGPHESNYLKLDCSKIKKTFNWRPAWNIKVAVSKTVEWTKCYLKSEDIRKCMDHQIEEYYEITRRI